MSAGERGAMRGKQEINQSSSVDEREDGKDAR